MGESKNRKPFLLAWMAGRRPLPVMCWHISLPVHTMRSKPTAGRTLTQGKGSATGVEMRFVMSCQNSQLLLRGWSAGPQPGPATLKMHGTKTSSSPNQSSKFAPSFRVDPTHHMGSSEVSEGTRVKRNHAEHFARGSATARPRERCFKSAQLNEDDKSDKSDLSGD